MVPLAPGALPRLNDTDSDVSDGDAGEKDAKRQKSEPTTPVSTSSRMPYEHDALMGITRVGTEEAKWFEEGLGTPEYHDAAEEPIRREEVDDKQPEPGSTGFQGGYGSSSLKECIDLLSAKNARPRDTPAPLDSGVDQDSVSPPQLLLENTRGLARDERALAQIWWKNIAYPKDPVILKILRSTLIHYGAGKNTTVVK